MGNPSKVTTFIGGMTSVQFTANKLHVLTCYERLNSAIIALQDSVRTDKNYPAWMYGYEDNSDARSLAIRALGEYFAADHLSPNETLSFYGAIGASNKTLDLIPNVNLLKTEFKQAMMPFSKGQVREPDPDNPGQTINVPLARVILRDLKLGRLVQRQLTRQIVHLPDTPRRIGFTFSATNSITRISVDEARNRLIRLGDDPNIKRHLAKLDKVSQDEVFAVVIPCTEHARQNIVFAQQIDYKDKEDVLRIQTKTQLPLFYPCVAGKDGPIIKPGTPKEQKSNGPGGKEIMKQPFLKPIHAHRYVESLREQKSRKFRDKHESMNKSENVSNRSRGSRP
ncbi:MAG: hypothetical protein OEY38_21590 [Gammaproteobacteria bacterium]|nr:hypothetical protein [Gammaproteobacteria bacterium]